MCLATPSVLKFVATRNLTQLLNSIMNITVAQKEITSQIDEYLVVLSSKTFAFEDKMTKY